MEFRILKKVGGEKYLKILKEKTDPIEASFKKDRFISSPDYNEANKLDEIFGRSPSQHESQMRWSILWLHSTFEAMDRIYGEGSDKAEEEKQNVLYAFYESGRLK